MNHKSVDLARKGSEVCVKIEPTPGDAPKLYGRHFDLEDTLVSKVGCLGVWEWPLVLLKVDTPTPYLLCGLFVYPIDHS